MIKKVDRTKMFEVVVPWDPAIDTKNSKMKDYSDTLDMKHLAFLPGQSPSVIHILPAAQWLANSVLQLGASQNQQYVDLARYGIQKITNLKSHLLDPQFAEIDSAIPVWQPENKLSVSNLKMEVYYTERDDFVIFNALVVQWVAKIILAQGFLMPGTPKPYLSLLPITELALSIRNIEE